ncbi:hypothetical protein SAMN05421858_4162 [Haladaptatus litoreus]|uniref:Uncharacterized protein n=1 Tax=Haladaptatus litoreus TaxID=553468 RepID=A0A1N7EAC9_9EURY|nr:hypothetical protein [Haladaptatus litoreus]SIR85010.1 hypothetical protein SAMN05421858_4162 [Haladaptatus litoreus]
MDESALQNRLHRIKRRQYLILALLLIPNFILLGDVIGLWFASVLAASLALIGFALLTINRRRNRTMAEQ